MRVLVRMQAGLRVLFASITIRVLARTGAGEHDEQHQVAFVTSKHAPRCVLYGVLACESADVDAL